MVTVLMASYVSRYVRKHLAGAINMRLTPEIRFIHDDSIQRGEEVHMPSYALS